MTSNTVSDSQKKHIVIVGNGMVGYKFCEKLLKKNDKGDFRITIFGEETRPAYDRVHLSAYFEDSSEEDLQLAPIEWYKENGIELHTGELITELDRDNQTVTSQKGRTVSYDKLILATGSSAFVPPIPGVEKKGVFVYRTIEDLDAITNYAKKASKAAVIGGGLLGLEAAKSAMDLGLETSVIEFAPRLMPRQLDEIGAQALKSALEDFNLEILLNKNTKQIAGNGTPEYLDFADGERLDADMVIISAGIRPRDELAKKADLEVGERGGIVVNDRMETNDPNIFAIGESALHRGMIYGLVAPGYEMADVVVENLTGGDEEFTEFDMSTKLKLVGVDVASFGDAFGETEENSKKVIIDNKAKGVYKRINISEDGKRLLGGMLVGDADDYNMLLQIAKNGFSLPPDPIDLIIGERDGETGAGQKVYDFPDDSIICSCESVTKGEICSLIEEEGMEDIDSIKGCTKAGTGCSGCVPMLDDLITQSMKARGKEVRKVICEHFDYTRQELYDLIKVKEIHTYDELLDEHGTGNGCEKCKPAVASLLASAFNEHVLKDRDTIQDTNDRFLANIQRGGTYSVIPRVPGGEITPDKLITIGQLAKKYGLYTKITGGQRINMMGARVDQLPNIWEELIEAGFESGHAYGKALRTVKSCVGSTWCRYGLHESVSFAIEIEERYRGLRAPHKLKGGVSGCVRECAEAQAKDFGIIATEEGWNLFVCGNGGTNPQHARLLATDLDEETLIKYLDRFLMFYIKTAEHLNRTSTWLNKMDGGLDYLKKVVVEDSLGIGEELEQEMQQLINVYACEWTEVVNDPELRKRFTHFVNSEDADPSLKFKDYREQKVPAPAGWEKDSK
ncbi:nitrite reductase large subunit NirB [Gracilimonas mengyeensis]|uniref:Assimilatory nitrite reductase (NAD(P)H) large subunit n=1 Tax=Gracilimonas mengyeensis TaxID=1302730 RepID=A0A521BLC0_9BACT|nr:nitrite reductase large subunit NirB [Gracilimonas mengyeensis]SMO47892.1 assimilatory nitrite reductase (NAD(P)H) large subunit precursor [Gracilimonas mengyeensis]